MDSIEAQKLVKTWQGHTQRGKIDDYERSTQMQKLLTELTPGSQSGTVAPLSGAPTPPKGATWLSHEIIVLGEGCIFRFVGMEGEAEGFDEPVFSIAVARVPLSAFGSVQMVDMRIPSREATSWRRKWDFKDGTGQVGLTLVVKCWEERGWGDDPDAALVHHLINALGWNREDSPPKQDA